MPLNGCRRGAQFSRCCQLRRTAMRFGFVFFQAAAAAAAAAARRHFSSSPVSRAITNVPYYHRKSALLQAQEALTDYFHTTRSLPYCQAEQIVANAPNGLASLVSSIPFTSVSDFPRDIRRHISFHPINEVQFFFESIGVSSHAQPSRNRCSGTQFLSDDASLLSAVSALVHYGFPWVKLGVLYTEDSSIFRGTAEGLLQRLSELETFGLDKVCLISICLAFPSLLAQGLDLDSSTGFMFLDLKCALRDSNFCGSLEDIVEDSFRLCRRIKVLYDLGCKKGEIGGLINGCCEQLFQVDEQDLTRKADFFCRLGMSKEEAALLLLRHPGLLELDLNGREISVKDYLVNAGFCETELDVLLEKYPHVLGSNKLLNLPRSLKALGLTDWLLGKLRCGDIGYLLPHYLDNAICFSKKMDSEFKHGLTDIEAVRRAIFLPCKLEFLQGIGFGRNQHMLRALRVLNGTRSHLQERFDFLLSLGIEYPVLCKMISARPKILNHGIRVVNEKVKFLCDDIGLNVQYLEKFAAYLCFDLENRIKPRYRMLDWLRDKGLLKKNLSPASVISTSEKRYVLFLSQSHPAALKIWLVFFKP